MRGRKKEKLVRGVGVNDADYPVAAHSVIDGRKKRILICAFYDAWSGMLYRCYSRFEQERHPTYGGCTVAPEWLTFTVFREWMTTQDWSGNQLDKDVLQKGNKVYGPSTCVFISGSLNKFMNEYCAARGAWPIGVNLHKKTGKLAASCHNPFTGKREHLGLFVCPDAAHEAWRARKHEHACRYADMQADHRIAQALRTRYARPEGM